MKALTMEQARELKPGDILYHRELKNADGTPQRWKVNGKVRTWKKTPERIEIPLKRGLYDYAMAMPQDFHLLSVESE